MEGSKQQEWDEHLESVLFAYRTTPIDGLDVSPFEVIYGRSPNLPIDNILFRENYQNPVHTLAEYLDMMYENQTNMYEVIERTRQERFDRNARNATSLTPRLDRKSTFNTHQADGDPSEGPPSCLASMMGHSQYWTSIRVD